MSEKGLVTGAINSMLEVVSVNEPDRWFGLCPPPCTVPHLLSEPLEGRHEPGPITVIRPRLDNSQTPILGIIAIGNTWLTAGHEQAPLAERICPVLAKLSLRAIFTPDIRQTLAEVIGSWPPQASRVEVPLLVEGTRLLVDAENFDQIEAEVAVAYLL